VRSDLARLSREVFARWHRPGHELHHVYGRVGRLSACALFLAPLRRKEHQGPGSPQIIRALREEYRKQYLAMMEMNEANRDSSTCWYVDCPRDKQDTCPLYRRAREAMEV